MNALKTYTTIVKLKKTISDKHGDQDASGITVCPVCGNIFKYLYFKCDKKDTKGKCSTKGCLEI